VKNIIDNIHKMCGRPEEYLISRYPKNYFDFYVDIGARGVKNPWHVNFIAEDNPDTLCVAYEPDIPYYEELLSTINKSEIKNLQVNKVGFGTGEKIKIPASLEEKDYLKKWNEVDTVTLTDIFNEYNLNSDDRWAIKIDCEGGEYSLLREECAQCVDTLKSASHIAIEFHNLNSAKRNNFFSMHNLLPLNFEVVEYWIDEVFSETHEIFLTSDEPYNGLRTYVMLSKDIVSQKNNLFWKELI